MKTNTPSRSAIEAAAADWVARRDAGLTAAEQAEFERWRSADPQHARALARHHRAWSVLDRPMQGGLAPAMVSALSQRSRARRNRRAAGATLASLALLLVAGIFSATGKREPTRTTPREHVVATAQVLQPETRVLPDGSIVESKSGTVLEVQFSPDVRAVVLKQGEAHFQVEKDSQRPFVVSAGRMEFRAVGTAFAVQLGQAQVELIVTHGIVAVEKPVGPASAAGPVAPASAPAATQTLVTVDAGKRVVLGLAQESGEPAPTLAALDGDELAQRLAWRATRLEFTGTRLADAVELLSRHNRIHFVIADASLREVEVTGFFRADNVDAFLLLLEGSFGAKVERSGKTITLRRSP